MIRGRTGAGKSSLIDAMCFALYGKVPRYGNDRSVAQHLLSEGARRMFVSFEFSVKGKHYRVERVFYSHSSRGELRLYEQGKPISIRSNEVEDYFKGVFGLDYETFTKVLVLPQNQFDRFLKQSGQREGRRILNELMGYSALLDRLKSIVSETYRELESRMNTINHSLYTLEPYTYEYIKGLQEEVNRLEEEYSQLIKRREELLRELELCRERDRVVSELSVLQEELEKLESQKEEYEKKERFLERAEKLLPYRDDLVEYERLLEEEERLRREKGDIERRLVRIREEMERVERSFLRLKRSIKNLRNTKGSLQA